MANPKLFSHTLNQLKLNFQTSVHAQNQNGLLTKAFITKPIQLMYKASLKCEKGFGILFDQSRTTLDIKAIKLYPLASQFNLLRITQATFNDIQID